MKDFLKLLLVKRFCDTTKDTEVIVALSTENRDKVDDMINKVIEAGGKEDREPQEQGWIVPFYIFLSL
ncbi:MAG: VOC family protein [Nitrososphaeraceae archaeon]